MSILVIDPDIAADIPVRQVFEEQGLENVLGVVCSPLSVNLPVGL